MPGKCKGRDQLTLFLIRYIYSCPLAHWHDAKWKKVHKYFSKPRPKNSSYFHVNLKGNKRYYKNWWGRNWVSKSGVSKIWVYEKVQSKGQLFKSKIFFNFQMNQKSNFSVLVLLKFFNVLAFVFVPQNLDPSGQGADFEGWNIWRRPSHWMPHGDPEFWRGGAKTQKQFRNYSQGP